MAVYTVGLAGSGADYICPSSGAQTKINEALTAAHTAGGGTVQLLPNSTFYISGQIKIGPNTVLTGSTTSKIKVSDYACGGEADFGTTGAWCAFPDGTPVIGTITGKIPSNIEIYGFEIDGNCQNQYTTLGLAKGNPSSQGSGVERLIGFYGSSTGTSVTNIYVHDMNFHDAFGEALHIRYAKNVRFEDCYCSNLQHDAIFFIETTGDNTISGNTIYAITDGGIRCDNCQNVKIHDNYIAPYLGTNNNGAWEHGENGIQIANESNKTTLTNNIDIYNNTFSNTGICGIWLNDVLRTAGATPQTVHIWNNTFSGCGITSFVTYAAGISVNAWGNGVTIDHNTFDGCYQEAIQILSAITSTSTHTININSNNIKNTKGAGNYTSSLSIIGYGIYNAVPTKVSAVIDGNYFNNNLKGNVYPTTLVHTNNSATPIEILPPDGSKEEEEEPIGTTPTRYVPGIRTIQPEWEFLGYYVYEEDGVTPHTSYINGWPVYIAEYAANTDRTVSTTKSPTLEGWNVGDFGLEGTDVTVTCIEDSLENAWKSISAWYARTPAILELGDAYEGWYLEGLPTKHSSAIRKSRGDIPDEYYEYTVLFTSIIPKFQNTTKRVRGRSVTGSMSWSSDDTQPGNQLKNSSFELWTANTDMTWKSQASTADLSWRCLAYNKVLKTLVAGAETGTGNRVMTQLNNGRWIVPAGLSNATNLDSDWRGACWIPPNDDLPIGRIVMVADAGTSGYRVMTSDDCDVFTARATPADNSWCSVCYIPPNDTLPNGRLVACAYSGADRVMYSDDCGVTWTGVTTAAEGNTWVSICYSEGLERLICVAYSGDTTHQVQYSDDYGATWTLTTTPAYQTWTSVVRAESLGLYVACSKSGTQKIMTSPDGLTWTLQSISTDAQLNEWRGICYSSELQLLVAVSDVSSGFGVMASRDGETWVDMDSPALAWWAVTFVPYEDPDEVARIVEPIEATVTSKVSFVENWNFDEWSGGTVDVAPDGWTQVTAGQSRSTKRLGSTYCYKVVGNGSDAIRGSIYQATAITPGYYTIGAWIHTVGVTQGTLNIDLYGGSPSVDTVGIQVTSNSPSESTWVYREVRTYVDSTAPNLRIYVDGTPNTGSSWYVDSVVLFRDATATNVTETDTGTSLTQTFTYTPSAVHDHAAIQTRFTGINVINSDGTFAYPVRSTIVKIDGTPTANFENTGRYITFDVSGLSATQHTIEIDMLYAPLKGRFVSVAGSGTFYRVIYSEDYGLIEDVAPDGWDFISGGQTLGRGIVNADENSYMIRGDGTTEDVGSISQPVQCDSGVSYILTATGKVVGLTQGKLAVDLYSGGALVKRIYWDSTESGEEATTKTFTAKYTVSPTDAVIKIHGIDTPNIGSVLYCDKVSFEKVSDHELNTIGNSIVTYGNEDTVPDIEVKSAVPAVVDSGITESIQVAFNTGSDTWYTSAAPYFKEDDTSLEFTVVIPALTGGRTYKLDQVSANLKTLKAGVIASCAVNVRCDSMFGGVETRVALWTSTSTTAVMKTQALNLTADAGDSITLKYFLKTSNTAHRAAANMFGYKITPLTPYSITTGTSSFSLYNAADPTTVIDLCNVLQYGSTITVKADYTGSFEYASNFEDDSIFASMSTSTGTVTRQAAARTLTLASGASIEFEFDTKFPITGVPFAEMFVVSGAPKLYIKTDGAYVEIDNNVSTSVVAETVYKELNSATTLQLAGETTFKFKIEAALGESLVLGSAYVHCDLVTIDAPRPKIYATGQPNTFTSVLTGNAVICTLKYRDRNMVI